MNFVNKLISRITTLLALCLAFIQIVIAYKYDSKDIMVFVLSIIFLVLVLANLGYSLFLTKKYGIKNEEVKDVKYNLICASVASIASVLIFIISMVSYLYLIW